MLSEYIVAAFKVLVGVINSERLIFIALIAVGIMLIWEIFALIFSFQIRFARGVKTINEYISRNGITGEAQSGLKALVSKMPPEFVRGYKAFERNPHSLPSDYIKRETSLDLELHGGIFNQNKSILKTYMNAVFVILAIFSLAIVADGSTEVAISGYAIAEALIVPFCFLLLAKVLFYVYAAIRQNQYRYAIDEFNEMINNFDKTAMDVFGYNPDGDKQERQEKETAKLLENMDQRFAEMQTQLQTALAESVGAANQNAQQDSASAEQINALEEKFSAKFAEINEQQRSSLQEYVEQINEKLDALSEEMAELKTMALTVPQVANVETAEESNEDEKTSAEDDGKIEAEENEISEFQSEKKNVSAKKEEIKQAEVMQDNFKPDFNTLLQPEEPKRGRGRPKKENNNEGEYIIKDDKQFEEALVRAEKLMRKNEQPLSASQTKRIEKQIKELIDAMNKYKEGK